MNTIETSQAVRSSPLKQESGSSEERLRIQNQEGQKPIKTKNTQTDKERVPGQKKSTPEPSVTPEKIKKTADKIQEYVDSIGRELSFEVEKESGDVVIKVFRKSDGSLVRKIPPEELVKQDELKKEAVGLLFEESA